MSRARELAKMGGTQQTIAGVSTFVGIATFAENVSMFSDLSVTGDLNVTGDLSYQETTATNSRITGVSTTTDLVVTQNADVAGIVSATTFEGTLATTNLSGTITNDQLAGSIANSKLVNDSVSFGGVSLDLGGSDATPAFNLSDATSYPTSSLSGTITNAQLAGSIANSKLSNSSVSYGGVSLSLGGSDATPAFNLSDATNYPTSSLSGTIANNQLANDSVSFGGVSLDLGGSDATPAFNLADATGLPISSGVSGLGANVAGFLGTPSSANLRSAVTDETGSGSLVFGTSPTIATPTITGRASLGDATLSGGLSVGAGLTVTGDLIVNGTTTTINSTTLTVDDKTVELASVDSPSDSTANAGGVVLKGSSDHTILWYNDNDHWESSEHFNLVSGKSYQIADTAVLSATALGSAVVSSSLTSVGTITSGTWNGTAIANAYLANSTISGTSLGSNLPTATFATSGTGLSGSATYNGTGSATFTVTSNATNSNTASAIVARDGSGNFSAGTITATLSGTATNATNVTTTANSTNSAQRVAFVSSSSGNISVRNDAGLTYNPSSNLLTCSGEVDCASLDVSGNADIDGTLEADAITVNGTALSTVIAGTTVTNASNAGTSFNLSGGYVSATTGTFSSNVDIGSATSNTLTITARVDSDIVPSTNNARALGTTSLRWSNIYSNDLDLSNEGSVNDFDGTWGSYLIQEGEEDLFILNRRNGKKYKFVLQEV